jgi:hypothetical protein
MWWKVIAMVLAVLVVAVTIGILYAMNRWQSDTRKLHSRMEAVRIAITPTSYDRRELEGLPVPVQRYFRTVLKEGQPLVTAVSVEHTGTFNMSETGEQWKSFHSKQRVITKRPGFVWEARIQMAPGITVYVHDAYVGGEGILTAKLFGLVSLVNLRGTPEVAQGELLRFFAEAAWYPTALLPSQGVQWEAVDDTSAKASLKDGETALTILFRFNESGLIESVRAEARGRTIAGRVIPTPWEGRWSHYEIRDGMLIPLDGEVAWVLPEGPKPYWRGHMHGIKYEFAK